MRSALIAITAALMFAATGCHHHNVSKGGCGSCGPGGGLGEGRLLGHLADGGGPFGHGGHGGGLFGGGHGGHGGGGLFGGGHGGGGGGGFGHHAGGTHGPQAPSPVARLGHGYYHDEPMPGPASPTYGYPYYTVRGPRDFLMDNPPSIGY